VSSVPRAARAVFRNQPQSEEIAQEVLVEVWRTAPRCRPDRGTGGSWILALARRRAVDQVRHAEVGVARDRTAAPLARTPEYAGVTKHVEVCPEQEQARRCLRTLTGIQRQAVILACCRILTYREIAETLGNPLGAVRTRLRDGRIRLRRLPRGGRMATAQLHRMAAVHALYPPAVEERGISERRLAGCEPTAQQSAGLCATAARLGRAVAAAPRSEPRERALQRINTVLQESPGVLAGPSDSAVGVGPRAAEVGADDGPRGDRHFRNHHRMATAESRESGRSGPPGRAGDLAGRGSVCHAESRGARLTESATGTVVISHARNQAVFRTSDVASPPVGKARKLWFDDGGTLRSAGLMNRTLSYQAVLMRGTVDGLSGMGVILEPADGSQQPTSTPMTLVSLPLSGRCGPAPKQGDKARSRRPGQ